MPTIDDLRQAIPIQMQRADVETIRANSKELISQLSEINEDVFEHFFYYVCQVGCFVRFLHTKVFLIFHIV